MLTNNVPDSLPEWECWEDLLVTPPVSMLRLLADRFLLTLELDFHFSFFFCKNLNSFYFYKSLIAFLRVRPKEEMHLVGVELSG